MFSTDIVRSVRDKYEQYEIWTNMNIVIDIHASGTREK